MGRIRTIKPEWLVDEMLAAQSDTVRVLSIGLILLADDYGRGRANPAFIRSSIWGYEEPPKSLSDVQKSIQKLVDIHFIELYEIDHQHYYQIRTWNKHQRIDNASRSTVPKPPSAESRGISPRNSAECGDLPNSAEICEILPQNSAGKEGKGEDRKGSERIRKGEDRKGSEGTHTSNPCEQDHSRARAHEAPQVCVCEFSNPEPDSDRPTLPCPPPEAPTASVDPEVAKADLVARALSATHLAVTGHATVISKKNVHLTQLIQWGIEERSDDPVGPIVNAYKAYLNSNGFIKENGYPFAWFAKEPAKYLLAAKPDRKAERSKKAADEYIDKMNTSDKHSVQCPTEIKDLIKTLKGVAANGT